MLILMCFVSFYVIFVHFLCRNFFFCHFFHSFFLLFTPIFTAFLSIFSPFSLLTYPFFSAPVTSPESVFSLFHRASANRATAATAMNDRSSRSHSVFSLSLIGSNSLTGETSRGLLNLIDLAGSERLSTSLAAGDRKTETAAINSSLSQLKTVITKLGESNGKVDYRSSVLTHLLQSSLGGQSKMLMFVNLAGEGGSLGESMCSLRFAAQVNSTVIGTATRNK